MSVLEIDVLHLYSGSALPHRDHVCPAATSPPPPPNVPLQIPARRLRLNHLAAKPHLAESLRRRNSSIVSRASSSRFALAAVKRRGAIEFSDKALPQHPE